MDISLQYVTYKHMTYNMTYIVISGNDIPNRKNTPISTYMVPHRQK